MNQINYIERLHETAVTDGSRTAVVYNGGTASMSYAELDRLSSGISDKIKSLDIIPGDVVMVMMKRNAFSVAAEIGVHKAGAVFVPIVPGYSEERIAYIRRDCGAKLMIDEDFFGDIPEYDGEFKPSEPRRDMVSIIYTSGSTGRPKGVVYDLDAYNETVNRISTIYDKLKGPLIFGAFAPMSFVVHIVEYITVFNCGGTVHIIPDDVRVDPIRIGHYYRVNKITAVFLSPKLFSMLKGKLPDLEIVQLGGEKISDIDPQDYTVLVCYSQTEALGLLMYKVDGRHKEAFIGRPLPGVQVFLFDEDGNEAGDMKEGEICAKGIYPRRYLNLPEESKKTFEETSDGKVIVHTGDIGIRHPNGVIEYLNRRDFMVKINGNRVDPSETERAMRNVPEIEEAAVKAFEENGRVYLCGYYVSGEEIEPRRIKEYLGKELPAYMIPARYVRMNAFPSNDNGKLDRNRLPEPELVQTSGKYIPPANEDDEKLCEIVAGIIGIEKVGMNDNFFDLGADSLQAAMLVSTIEEKELGIIDVKQVYENPVLSDLSRCIANSRLIGEADYTILSRGNRKYSPLIVFHTANMGCEAYRKLQDVLPDEIPFMGFENHNLNYPDFPITSINGLAKYYRMVGSYYYDRLDEKGTGIRVLGGWSLGGTLAFEAAVLSESVGERVSGVVLLDPFLVDEKNRQLVTAQALDPNLRKYFEQEALFEETKTRYNVDRMLKNNSLVAKMLADYRPSGRLAARVLFIKATVVRDTDGIKKQCFDLPANGYEKYCDNIRIAEVNCNHDELGNNDEALKIITDFVTERAEVGSKGRN